MTKIRPYLSFFIAGAVTLFTAIAWAQDDFLSKQPGGLDGANEFLKVEQAYQVSPTIEGDQLQLFWSIHPGYYLYQHQFKAEVRNSDGANPIDLVFEPGKEKYDEIFQKDLVVYYDNTTVKGPVPAIAPPFEIKISSQGCADAGLCYPPRHQYFSVEDTGAFIETDGTRFQNITSDSSSNAASAASPSNASVQNQSLLLVIIGAIIGGLILNLMPCVFPVLSLKALSFASSHMNAHKQHLHGWSYTAGVVGSFLVVGIVIVIARGAGESLGWGFQLQQPSFVAVMAYLFFIMGLSLSGMFYIGTSLMGAGQSLTAGEGLKSSFFTGVLAALVASPCSAPLMAPALGYAITQPAIIALLVFASVGLGLALPFILLSYLPGLAKYLPAPGPWMEKLKQVLAFPLYLTSVWLLWVLGNQTSSAGAMAILAGAVLVTFAIWLLQQHASTLRGKAFVRGLAAVSIIFSASLVWKVGDFAVKDTGLWEEYSPARLAELREEGTPVFVDLTADWCITCKFNERTAINTDEVTKFVLLNDIVMLQGDWTNEDPEISALLAEFGRNGVPLYLMYPSSPNSAPEVLPQLLTQAMVLEYMERALATNVGNI